MKSKHQAGGKPKRVRVNSISHFVASVLNLVTKRKHAKVRSWDGVQGAESWDSYEYSQRDRKVAASQWTPGPNQGAEYLLVIPRGTWVVCEEELEKHNNNILSIICY